MVSYMCIADSVCSHPLYLTIFNPTSPLSIFPDLLLCDSLLIFTWTEYYMTFGLELSVGTLWLFHWCIDMTVTVSLRIHQWPTVHHRKKVIIKPSPSRDWVLTGPVHLLRDLCLQWLYHALKVALCTLLSTFQFLSGVFWAFEGWNRDVLFWTEH